MSRRPTTPQLRGVSVIRCDANGVENDGGAYFKISATTIKGAYPYGVYCIYTEADHYNERYIPILNLDDHIPDEYRLETDALGGDLDADKNYEVYLTIWEDAGYTATTTVMLPSQAVFMHKDGAKNSIAIGEKVTEENTVSIAEKLTAVVKGLLKTYGNIYFYDKNGTRGAYANYRVICVPSSSGNVDATMGVGYVDVGNGIRAFASMRYDPENNRGYVFINDAPESDTDATNKAYVDAKINALRKELGLEEE